MRSTKAVAVGLALLAIAAGVAVSAAVTFVGHAVVYMTGLPAGPGTFTASRVLPMCSQQTVPPCPAHPG